MKDSQRQGTESTQSYELFPIVFLPVISYLAKDSRNLFEIK